MNRRIIFRTEASPLIGLGHLRRCISLARALKALGEICIFAVNKHSLELNPTLASEFQTEIFTECRKESTETHRLLIEKDLLVVDSYDLGLQWEEQFSKNKLIVIDDLNRPHKAHIILDQNFRLDYANCYDHFKEYKTLKLLGPEFALIDSAYAQIRKQATTYLKREKKLFISYGGSSQKELVQATIEALNNLKITDWKSELITGPSHVHDVTITNSKNENISILNSLPSFAEKLAQSQLALGAGGIMNWERMCMGVPSCVLTISENQREVNIALAKAGYIELLGDLKDFDIDTLCDRLAILINDTKRRAEISTKSMKLVDGLGAERVANKILETCLE